MQAKYEQEIDIVDLLLDWLSHWRSLFICLLIGCVVGVGWYYTDAKKAAEAAAAAEEAEATAVAETETTEEEEVAPASIEECEATLSEAEISEVNELVAMYNSYQDVAAAYYDAESDYSTEEARTALSEIAVAREAISTLKARLTEDQQTYFYLLLGFDVAEVAEVAIIKKIILSWAIIAIVHFIFFALIYILGGKVKHSDNLGEMLGCSDFVPMVDWKKADSLKGLDRAIYNAKMKGTERLDMDEAMQINADTVADLVERNAKIALIGKEAGDEAKAFIEISSKTHSELDVTYITGVSNSAQNSQVLSDTTAAVLIVKVGASITAEVVEEYKKLLNRNIKVIGVFTVE